jgi:hypothetical protein
MTEHGEMNAINKEICRQIKDGIDAAQRQGVWCSYPDGVWIQGQYHKWPYGAHLLLNETVIALDKLAIGLGDWARELLRSVGHPVSIFYNYHSEKWVVYDDGKCLGEFASPPPPDDA